MEKTIAEGAGRPGGLKPPGRPVEGSGVTAHVLMTPVLLT